MRHRYAIEDLGGRNLNVAFGDSGSVDAFSRLRTSSPTTEFETQCQYTVDPTRMEAGATNSGVTPAHGANTRMVLLQINSGGASPSTSYFQSYEYIPYQPGKSQFIAITGLVGSAVAGAIKDFGYGDARNGIFYRQNGTGGLQFVRRTYTSGAAVDNPVDQADWNLDRFDGTGSSGITLDVTKVFILVIDLQFLGMGRVRIGFDVDGIIIYAHEFLNANSLTTPYMQSATLPVKAEISAAGALGSTATAYFKCAAVMSEGGFEVDQGYDFSAEASVTGINATPTAVASLRPTALYPYAGTIVNRGLIVPESFELLVASATIRYELWVGRTFTVDPTWSQVNTTYSGAEIGQGGTLGATTGLMLFSGYVTAGAQSRGVHAEDIAFSYPICLDRSGARRILGTLTMICYTAQSAPPNADVKCSFNWREVR